MSTVALVDYGMGNRRSVEKALEHVGGDVRRTADPEEIRAAGAVVVPGVGAFPEAMRRLNAAGLDEVIRERAESGTPVLGICLGMQLLFEHSTDEVTIRNGSRLTDGLGERAAFYHVHSFVCRASDDGDVVGRGEYGERFASIVERDNVAGVQFHPEKSSRDGLALLANFVAAA